MADSTRRNVGSTSITSRSAARAWPSSAVPGATRPRASATEAISSCVRRTGCRDSATSRGMAGAATAPNGPRARSAKMRGPKSSECNASTRKAIAAPASAAAGSILPRASASRPARRGPSSPWPGARRGPGRQWTSWRPGQRRPGPRPPGVAPPPRDHPPPRSAPRRRRRPMACPVRAGPAHAAHWRKAIRSLARDWASPSSAGRGGPSVRIGRMFSATSLRPAASSPASGLADRSARVIAGTAPRAAGPKRVRTSIRLSWR